MKTLLLLLALTSSAVAAEKPVPYLYASATSTTGTPCDPLKLLPGCVVTNTPVTKPATSSTLKTGQLTQAQATINPTQILQSIQTFAIGDLQAAIADAQAQPAGSLANTLALPCWQALLAAAQNPIANPLPNQLGAFLAIQKAIDLKSNLAALLLPSASNPLTQVNMACAPLVVDVNTTLLLLGINTGIVVGTGGVALPATAGLLPLLLH
jgi:hypothetical protein